MDNASHFDLIVIGSGSAGSSAWYKARQLGKTVAVFEGETLGGECPTYACVPTKALLHCAEVFETVKDTSRFGIAPGSVEYDYARVKAWKDSVISQTGAALGEQPYREMGVHVVRHHARFVSPGAVEAAGQRYTADYFLIATGASQRLPPIEGLAEAGYITFREAIDLTDLPRSLFVLGGGAVGCEFTQLFSSFGVDVTISDRNERLLHNEDPEAGDFLREHFERRGVTVLLEASVQGVQPDGPRKRLRIDRAGRNESLTFDEVLIATGKAPNVDLGLEAAGVNYDSSRGVAVNQLLQSSNPRVYASGDVAGPFRFTHAAGYQGSIACNNMFSNDKQRVDYSAMPRCVFTLPEVASVGLTEAKARESHDGVRVGMSSIADNDRALTSGAQQGFVKVVTAADGRLLGGVACSARAGELIHELALAIRLGATAAQVASTIHAFPTFSEALGAACAEVRHSPPA